MIVVLPGQNARINWTLVGDPSRATLFWYFTRRGDFSEEIIAVKFGTVDATITNSSLPRVSIENPPTLVLKNVDARYNGKYRLLDASVFVESSVELFIAGKFFFIK